VKQPVGTVTTDCYRIDEAPVPEPADGDVLVRNIYLSCDPYMRGRMNPGPNGFALGEVVPARVVGQVLQSRHPEFRSGDIVWDFLGWELYSLAPQGKQLRHVNPELGPISHAISVLGMPGLTAWIGMYDIGNARAGETVFVSAASGAVGQTAGQLARIRGCRVIGSVGSDAKVEHVIKRLGFDGAFNYKTRPVADALDELCTGGIDVYFDNVGGETLDAVLLHINSGARIPVCGQISRYGSSGAARLQHLDRLESRHATMTPFHVGNHMHRYDAVIPELAALLRRGELVYHEDIVDGIDNAPDAFIGMMRGDNLGKRLVRVGADPTRRREAYPADST
jgi:NADPH-dependent curcumin reductase CurA